MSTTGPTSLIPIPTTTIPVPTTTLTPTSSVAPTPVTSATSITSTITGISSLISTSTASQSSTSTPTETSTLGKAESGLPNGVKLTLIIVGAGIIVAVIAVYLFRKHSLSSSSSFKSRLFQGNTNTDELTAIPMNNVPKLEQLGYEEAKPSIVYVDSNQYLPSDKMDGNTREYAGSPCLTYGSDRYSQYDQRQYQSQYLQSGSSNDYGGQDQQGNQVQPRYSQ